MRSIANYVVATIMITASAVVTTYMLRTLSRNPLFPLRLNDMSWLREWLAFSVVDFYGLAVALACFMLRTHGLVVGGAWAIATMVLGSPVALVYAAWTIGSSRSS